MTLFATDVDGVASRGRTPLIDRADGSALCSAPLAILKGALESDVAVDLVIAPDREPFRELVRMALDDDVQAALARHRCRVRRIDDPARAIEVATRAAVTGRYALVLVPDEGLLASVAALERVAPRLAGATGAVTLVLEDAPGAELRLCPRRLVEDLGAARVEPPSVEALRDVVEPAMRLAHAGRGAAAVIVSPTLLRTSDTIAMRPNRVADFADAAAARRRRGPRPTDDPDLLRLARRLELNDVTALPSPGERAPLGLVAVGRCAPAVEHLLRLFDLRGRVPLLRLGMTGPIDESLVERLLSRCARVVVLEPRPGSIAPGILAAGEAARRRGIEVAEICWSVLPANEHGERTTLAAGETTQPSILARRLAHLLEEVRPGVDVVGRLEPPSRLDRVHVPERGAGVGEAGAMSFLRQSLAEVDQWLRDREIDAEVEERTILAIEGLAGVGGRQERVVIAELWERSRFLEEGVAMIREAAFEDVERLVVVCDLVGREGLDCVRLGAAAVPSTQAERVDVRTTVLGDRVVLVEDLRAAALSPGITVLVAREGPRARFDPVSIERDVRDVDRLGFTPLQRVVRPADRACDTRFGGIDAAPDDAPVHGVDAVATALETRTSFDRLPRGTARRLRARVRPLLEQVEVVRTRPPLVRTSPIGGGRIPLPRVEHARAGAWRAHIAGWRGDAPGIVATILAEAGGAMGYHVACVADRSVVGPGRHAFAQVLFARPIAGFEGRLPAGIPYGEADLLLGLDPVETLRALGPDPALRVASSSRTYAVVNVGALASQTDDASIDAIARLDLDVRRVCRAESVIDDLARATRRSFLTERVLDASLLGIAYQLGAIPLELDALEAAIARVEATGFGRLLDAFRAGRLRVVEGPRESPRRRSENDRVGATLRRVRREVARDRGGGPATARALDRLLREAIDGMPGLAESEAGRASLRDLVGAAGAGVSWGGVAYAARFVDLVRRLYDADSGGTGRRMTRAAVHPLAEAMLIRDPIHVAMMSTSVTQRRRTRERMAVRPARGDEMERRFLTRFELLWADRRWRLDWRTSDWPARFVRLLRWVVPDGWRGTPQQRALRDAVETLVERAIVEAPGDRERWTEIMRRLAAQAENGRLREMSPAELRLLAEGVQ